MPSDIIGISPLRSSLTRIEETSISIAIVIPTTILRILCLKVVLKAVLFYLISW
jgi:hypothetical protein